MMLRYEDLLASGREAAVARLEAFTRVRGLRPEPFEQKLNTFEGREADGHSPTGYIAPEALTEADWAALQAEAGQVMARHYPDPQRESA